MSRYALLILPALNRVYSGVSARLVAAELAVTNDAVLGGRLGDVGRTTIGGVPYVTFTADDLSERDIAVLSNLSSLYAVFELRGEALHPVEARPLDRFDDDLLTIQKYVGKTNEHFTKLLLNVSIMSTAFPADMVTRKLSVFDPLCGRGTTLNQALMYGFDASGTELDTKSFESYAHFVRTWLQNKRLKHRAELATLRRNRRVVGRRLDVVVGATREDYRAGRLIHLDVVNADTRRGAEFFRGGSFDVLATDAPYGVQHGSRTTAGSASRDPLGLLRESVPVWAGLLRPGGAMGIAWNTHVARRDELAAILADAGLVVCDSPGHRDLGHRVDQAIVRDVVVARRPVAPR